MLLKHKMINFNKMLIVQRDKRFAEWLHMQALLMLWPCLPGSRRSDCKGFNYNLCRSYEKPSLNETLKWDFTDFIKKNCKLCTKWKDQFKFYVSCVPEQCIVTTQIQNSKVYSYISNRICGGAIG